GERGGRADHQVGPVHGQPAGTLALHGQAQGVAGAGRHLVVERDGVVDRLHVVVAVGSPRAHPEVEVDLGGDAYPHGGRHGRVRTLEPLLAQRLAHRRLPCAATAANCSTVSDSPRVPGSIPAARRIAAARSAPPAQAASAARSVLRRWANAASTTSNTSSRVTSVRGGSRRVDATSPDSTWGTGQNTAAGTRPAGRALAYQASFTDGTPYNRLPGAAVSRSATSRWTIISPPLRGGRTASRCSSAGTATLYGRFATRAVGCGSGRLSRRSASPVWTDRAAARAGTRAATVAGSAPASTGSISTAWTCATAGSSARVSEPSPGPTSSTTSSGARSAAATILRTVLGSCTKCCPSRLTGRMPSRAASSRISAGPSSPVTAAPATRRVPEPVRVGGAQRPGPVLQPPDLLWAMLPASTAPSPVAARRAEDIEPYRHGRGRARRAAARAGRRSRPGPEDPRSE